MSICLAQDTLTPAAQLIAFTLCLVFVAGLVVLIGAHRPRSVLGPSRATAQRAPWRIAMVAVIVASVWLGLQVAYMSVKARDIAHAHPGERFDPARHLGADDYAFLATVPFIVGFGLMLALDRFASKTMLAELGLTLGRVGRGIALGLLGILVVMPLIFGSGILLELVYRAIHYEHPLAHDLLAVMKQARNPLVKSALIFGAAIAAPFFEEYLFRGHIQTFLVGLFTMSRKPSAPTPATDANASSVLQYEVPPVLDTEKSTRPIWLAIALTSVLFAIIHPLWTAPLIFVLAMCLGYTYQRTGNLWVPIVIHALFNTINTIYYLCFS
jgi:membrane protease YdiL (CAAX protease family)